MNHVERFRGNTGERAFACVLDGHFVSFAFETLPKRVRYFLFVFDHQDGHASSYLCRSSFVAMFG